MLKNVHFTSSSPIPSLACFAARGKSCARCGSAPLSRKVRFAGALREPCASYGAFLIPSLACFAASGKSRARCGSAPYSRVTNFFAYHKRRMRLLLIAANLFLIPKNASVFGSPVCTSLALCGSPACLRLLVLPQAAKSPPCGGRVF